MSSPHKSKSRSPDETRTQDSVRGSSQYGAVDALEDTVSSVFQGRAIQSVTRVSGGTLPNSAYSRGRAAARSRSASPRPRRVLSPVGLSVAQRCAQLAEADGQRQLHQGWDAWLTKPVAFVSWWRQLLPKPAPSATKLKATLRN